MTTSINPIKYSISPDEYPPKWVGTKFNGVKKMVYRLDESNCEMGLTFHIYNHIESEYRWEHFDLIQRDK